MIEASELFKAEENAAALDTVRAESIDTDPVYIVFTSGSTGVPKGVTGCHRALIDYANALCPVIGADEESVFAMQVPLYVDACMKELLSVIKCGSTACLMQQSMFMSPIKAVEFLNEHRVNTLCWVASALTIISGLGAFEDIKPLYMRTVCFGSEVFPVKQLRLWKEACPGARFINLYGPTEATGMSFYFVVDRELSDGEPIPAGRPFDNTGFMLLRDDDTQALPGETGEICIRGTALTHGYFDDPERTAAAFTQNPLNPHYPELIYRTGDLGRLNERGELVFVSRKDQQIKNMGHRIELGEIEACADGCEGVVRSCCLFDKQKGKIFMFYMARPTKGRLGQISSRHAPAVYAAVENKTARRSAAFGKRQDRQKFIKTDGDVTMDEILEILDGLGLDADFENCTTLVDDGILESLDIVTIIAELSDAFDITIPARDIVPENFNSAEAMLGMVNRLLDE